MKFFGQHLARALNRFGLVAKETGRADVLLKLGRRNFQIVLGFAVFAKQIGGHDVDALVRALSGENRGNQQLERVRMIQGAMRIRVRAFEKLNNLFRSSLTLGFSFSH